MNLPQSLQEKYSPQGICFGCGPANNKGLRIRSFPKPASNDQKLENVICDWKPEAHHEAFPGVLNGGIIGSLLDCHCNWTAAWYLMKASKTDHPPCTVTADYSIRLLRPTPSGEPVHLEAHVVESKPESLPDRVVVEGTLSSGGKVCATCRGTFVAVKPGHPAYHRW